MNWNGKQKKIKSPEMNELYEELKNSIV